MDNLFEMKLHTWELDHELFSIIWSALQQMV